jgi:hypothetical protein
MSSYFELRHCYSTSAICFLLDFCPGRTIRQLYVFLLTWLERLLRPKNGNSMRLHHKQISWRAISVQSLRRALSAARRITPSCLPA